MDPSSESGYGGGDASPALCFFVFMMAAVVGLWGSPAKAGTQCLSAAEQSVLETRVVQSELMVAALLCGERARYNAFVKRFESELVNRGDVLRSLFRRTYGQGASARLNRFVTDLANAASHRSLTAPRFCAEAVTLFEALEQTPPSRLSDMAASRPSAGTHGFAGCARGKKVDSGRKKSRGTG
ncbi:MAG: hypothetical protein FD149_561 [Rhodospirillaceae bacterium]|nr:MAG: hypothetical protein FD149_561 [Rhodospirillaceae bacterium]